jgi:hypothetical protein
MMKCMGPSRPRVANDGHSELTYTLNTVLVIVKDMRVEQLRQPSMLKRKSGACIDSSSITSGESDVQRSSEESSRLFELGSRHLMMTRQV